MACGALCAAWLQITLEFDLVGFEEILYSLEYNIFLLFTFQNAVMTFEEEKLNLALSTLRATEKRLSSDLAWSPSLVGLQQTVRSRLWGFGGSSSTTSLSENQQVIASPLVGQKCYHTCQGVWDL